MSYFCYGCMRKKEQRPVCEHCGFSELSNNPGWALPIGLPLKNRYLVGKANYYSDLRDHSVTYIGMDREGKRRVTIEEYYPYWCSRKGEFGQVTMHPCDVLAFCEGWKVFVQKADPLTRLCNLPGIQRAYDFFEANGTCYVIREYMKGKTLVEYCKERGGTLPPEEVWAIVERIASILEPLHQMEVIHRSICPENIWIRSDGRVKLGNMGILREKLEELFPDRSLQEDPPEPTQGYWPRERQEPAWPAGWAGPWTDIYGICATVWYCLTGKTPPMWHSELEGELTLDWESIPGLTAGQSSVLRRGMMVDSQQRVQSIQELTQALLPIHWTTGDPTDQVR